MKLFAQKDAEEFLKSGATEFRYNRDIRLTPGAKDVFSEAGVKVVFDAEAAHGHALRAALATTASATTASAMRDGRNQALDCVS